MTFRSIAQALCPPIFVKAIKGLRSRPPAIAYNGNYTSWEEAERDSTGYRTPEILANTRSALLKVKAGQAAFERDSLVFDTIQHEFALLAGLLRVTASNNGRLSVLDFGGSLGSTYFQCREFLPMTDNLRWSVVDQPAQVSCGQVDFANKELHFYPTIEECLRVEKPNVLLLLGVVQYLPQPYSFLDEILRHEFPYVIVERTGFTYDNRARLTVQHVPSWIYDASYPAWFLSEPQFRKCFEKDYELVCEYDAKGPLRPQHDEARFKGFQFQLKSTRRNT